MRTEHVDGCVNTYDDAGNLVSQAYYPKFDDETNYQEVLYNAIQCGDIEPTNEHTTADLQSDQFAG